MGDLKTIKIEQVIAGAIFSPPPTCAIFYASHLPKKTDAKNCINILMFSEFFLYYEKCADENKIEIIKIF
jgi:hypothetical protein